MRTYDMQRRLPSLPSSQGAVFVWINDKDPSDMYAINAFSCIEVLIEVPPYSALGVWSL